MDFPLVKFTNKIWIINNIKVLKYTLIGKNGSTCIVVIRDVMTHDDDDGDL